MISSCAKIPLQYVCQHFDQGRLNVVRVVRYILLLQIRYKSQNLKVISENSISPGSKHICTPVIFLDFTSYPSIYYSNHFILGLLMISSLFSRTEKILDGIGWGPNCVIGFWCAILLDVPLFSTIPIRTYRFK